MDQTQRQIIKRYLDLLLRKKKLIIIAVIIAMVAGIGHYLKSPKRYRSSALLIYQRQKINPTKLSPDQQGRTREMINTLSQQVTSRTSLEGIIKQFNLYSKALERLPMEDVVMRMRDHVDIRQTKGDIFEVSYTGSLPKKVMLVTNALAARFVEENLRFREEKASETSAYVKDELEMSKASLDKKEELMRDYKLKYYNEMPQQLQMNMSRLTALQTQLQSNQDGIRDLERTRILIQEQITLRKEALQARADLLESQGLPTPAMASPTPVLSEEQRAVVTAGLELEEIRKQLDNLLLKYTQSHPEVRRVTKMLDAQQKRYDVLVAALPADGDTEPTSDPEEHVQEAAPQLPLFNDKQLEELSLQLKEVSLNIQRLKDTERSIAKQIEQYQKWINATPVREAEWSALTRDYEQLHAHYQELVARSLNAESAESLERRQKGSQFKIVDSAHYPEKPYTPDFMKIMAMALAMGGGVGFGLVLLLEAVDTSFKDAIELEKHLQVPVICSIPVVETGREEKLAKIKTIVWTVAFVAASSMLLLGLAYLWRTGRIII